MKEGGFTVTEMCISTAAAVGETTTEGDKPAMVVVIFCNVQDCAASMRDYVFSKTVSTLWY